MPRHHRDNEGVRHPWRPKSDDKKNACGCYTTWDHPEGLCWRETRARAQRTPTQPTRQDDEAPWVKRAMADATDQRKRRKELGLLEAVAHRRDTKSKPQRHDGRRRVAI